MYLSQSIGNIVQKFNNQQTNIIYDLSGTIFDLHIGLCRESLYCIDDKLLINDQNMRLSCIRSDQIDLMNFTSALNNNILGYASNMKYIPFHLNVGIFTHNNKPIQIKKEDLLLINNNLTRTKRIFFSKTIADSWKLPDAEIIQYGVDRSSFYETNPVENRTNKILLISHQSQNLNIIKQILLNNQIEFDVLDTIPFDVAEVRETLNRHKICIDFSENITNLITAISCGCVGISHNTNNLKDSFISTPNLYFGDSISDIIQITKSLQQTYVRSDIKNYFESHFNFNTFRDNITRIINTLHRETFYI